MNTNRTNHKVILLGDTAVGKTNILTRLSSNDFSDEYSATIGVEFIVKSFELKDRSISKAQIWDTAGQERYAAMMTAYYRKAKGAIIVFSLTDPKSLRSVDKWREYLQQHAGNDVALVLVGNKADAPDRKVNTEEVARYSAKEGIPYFEVSAKTGQNINESFQTLIEMIHDKEKQKTDEEELVGQINKTTQENNIMHTNSFRLKNDKNRSYQTNESCCY